MLRLSPYCAKKTPMKVYGSPKNTDYTRTSSVTCEKYTVVLERKAAKSTAALAELLAVKYFNPFRWIYIVGRYRSSEGYSGGLSTALQNAVDKPLMPKTKMQKLEAQVTSSLLQFPETTIEALQEDEINLESVLCAKFTTGRAGLAWLACGPQLEVTNSVTGERLSAYRFSTVTERPPSVVAVKEFSWQKKTGLLVGLVEAEGSILCLYDVGISKVVKSVVLPGSVTAVEPLVNDGGASASTQHLHQSLRWFFGVAAVVTDVGHVLLIDLCLDDISCNQDELEASGQLRYQDYLCAGNKILKRTQPQLHTPENWVIMSS
ncbi:unnamed protein product [Ranitomeya imitator]|uniref:ELYS beta-propeller domain-containing protein n=1 Tax=Ranitomeya imitator TaxID=111125 RepID=A0ABN9L3U8_9NEOB|nr:unnamed protein product [Ranitomeya imitator]